MIAVRVRHGRIRVRAAPMNRRMALTCLLAVLVAFVFAFALGRATRGTTATFGGEPSPERSSVSVRVAIPSSLSAVPPIATLVSVSTDGAPAPRHHPGLASSFPRSATARSPAAGLVPTTAPAVAPTVTANPPAAAAPPVPSTPAASGVPSKAPTPTPTRAPSRSGEAHGGSGSFDSSG